MKFSEDIKRVLESSKVITRKKTLGVYEKFGYLDNPFPTKSYPIWKRFYDQEAVKEAFEDQVLDYIGGEQKNTTFFLLGGNRVGKTHFLKHHFLELENVFRNKKVPYFPSIFIKAPPGEFLQNYRDIILEINRHYEEISGEEFFLQFLKRVQEKQNIVGKMPKDDLWRVLNKLCSGRLPISTGDFWGLYPIFMKWLEGTTLENNEKQKIGVFSPLKTSATCISVLKRIIGIGRDEGIIKGLVVFLDEFEVLWQVTRVEKRARYLQDLREFIDEISHGLLFVVAMTEDAEHNLEEEYPALYHRLSSPNVPHILKPIKGTEDAWGYANYFLEKARKEFEEGENISPKDEHIISKAEVIEALERVSPELKSAQGDFFDALHELVERKVKGRN